MTQFADGEALRRAIVAAGGTRELGRALGCSASAVGQWRRAPAHRVLDLERLSGVPRWELRPDLYPLERERVAG